MFLRDGHIRGLLKLDMPDEQEHKALLREAMRVFMGPTRWPPDALRQRPAARESASQLA